MKRSFQQNSIINMKRNNVFFIFDCEIRDEKKKPRL